MILLPLIVTYSNSVSVTGDVILSRGKPAGSAVVYLEGGAKSAPMKHAVVDQKDRRFIPHISVVTVGTTVDFPNSDTVFHNVFAEFDAANRFDLGMYPRGTSKKIKFKQTGLVTVLCNVHSEMSAYVMVVETPYFAVADSRGHFAMVGVPPGEYNVHVWHESGEILSQQIQISGGQPLTLTTRRH